MTFGVAGSNSGAHATASEAIKITPVFSHDIFAWQRIGGISRYFCNLHAALRERDVRSIVLAPLHVNELLANTRHVVGAYLPERIQGIRGVGRVMTTADRIAEPLILSLLSSFDFDLIHHRTYYSAIPPSSKYATAITVYDMIHERYPKFFSDRTTERKRLWCESADVIIAISNHTKMDLVHFFDIDPDRIVVCHLGVVHVAPQMRLFDELAAAEPFLLYDGDRLAHKNFRHLIEAYGRSQSARDGVRLIAFGQQKPSPGELAAIDEQRVSHLVSFAGGDDAALASYYATAVGLVYPSLDEGFGLPPLEAMTHACPVAASGTGAIPEVVADAALLFDPVSSDATSQAIDRLTFDHDLRANLVSRGAERVELFTWREAARVTLAAYSIALETARARSAESSVKKGVR
jgi:glycosyltransferase involved in cell wall biosynthesis